MTNTVDADGIPFSLGNPWKFPLHGLPLRCSVPLPEGVVRDPAKELVLLDEHGNDCQAQWRVLSTWNDGSARFALMDYAEAVIAPRMTLKYTLKARPAGVPVSAKKKIVVRDEADAITIDTGRLAWTFGKKTFALGQSIRAFGRDWLAGQASDLCIIDELGVTHRATRGDFRISLEESGPYRVIVRIDGNHGPPGTPGTPETPGIGGKNFMDYTLRLHFTAGGSQVLMLHHIRNRHGGIEGRKFQRCWLEGSLAVGPSAVRRILHTSRGLLTTQAVIDCPERVEIETNAWPVEVKPDRFRFPKTDREISWKGPMTVIRNGESLREKEEEICPSINEQNPNRAISGDRRACASLIDLHEPGGGGMLFKFAMANPDSEFPLLLSSELNRFEIDFFPAGEEMHHFGEGMGKTRDVLFHFHDDSLGSMDLVQESNNLSYPGVVGAGPDAYRAAKFADMHRTMPFLPNKYPVLESKIDLFRMAQHSLLWPLALGWKHYGDEWGARGSLHMKNVWQLINNEEDYVYCCMIDAWRRGLPYDALATARHVMDIDYIDYSDDPRRNGATCPHSEDHVNGEVYTSHQWCQGLLYFYLATGDEEALRICKRVGDCLHWWITGPMSYALRASGRETAWPLLSLAALYEVTHEEKYKQAAMRVVDDMIDIQKEHGRVCWETPLGSGIFSQYMLTMTFNGIWDVWAATGEPRVLQLWKDITKPVLDSLEQPSSWGYVIFRNWQIKVADLTVLVRWYELTGDRKYLDLGKNGLRLIQAAAPTLENQFQALFAMWYRHIILFLKHADEAGMIDDNHTTMVW